MFIYPVGLEPDTHISSIIFFPIYLSISIFDPVSSLPWKVNDLFTLKGETITSEVINDLKEIGFVNITTEVRESYDDSGHPHWIYVKCYKAK